MTATGCPQCGSDRLRSASHASLGHLLATLLRQRRYQCPTCGWVGRRRRLRRRTRAVPALTTQRRPTLGAYVFFTIFIAVVFGAGGLLVKNCDGGGRPQAGVE